MNQKLIDIKNLLNNNYLTDSQKIEACKKLFQIKNRNIPEEIRKIIEFCCDFIGIEYDIFFKNCRKIELVYAKKIYAYLTKDLFQSKQYSCIQLASFINKDHSTYLYYLSCVSHNNLKFDKELQFLIESLKQNNTDN